MTTPGKARQSGIPTPGRITAIPTPARSRSASSTGHYTTLQNDVELMSRAFADAIKSNDPAQHRSNRVSDASSVSVALPSGRRSVAGRPPSVASSSTATHKSSTDRPKTPSIPRPPSRHSDVLIRSMSRNGRNFEVGDNVRIESLGFEGTLRFIGEIDGKPGLWAGVELSGGFTGKGKNNGTVNGMRYFSCPDKCGVFVATTKLSSPTVVAATYKRPSSVASSRGGRVTPLSGRLTPSNSLDLSNGRVTPATSSRAVASGRVTPGMTPSGKPRLRTATLMTKDTSLADKITQGSRASKYMTMTAQQLNSKHAGTTSPSRANATISNPSQLLASPSQISRTVSSPTRPAGSPFSTPKPISRSSGLTPANISGTPTKNRPSISTPRPRVPSAVAMPPPALPTSRSVSSASQGDLHTSSDVSTLERQGLALHQKISRLLSENAESESSTVVFPQPQSEDSSISQLQSQLQALVTDNERMRAQVSDVEIQAQALQEALSHSAELETKLADKDRVLHERETELGSMERARNDAFSDMEAQRIDNENKLRTLQLKLEDSNSMVKTLREAIERKEGQEHENDVLLQSKDAEISLLQSQLDRTYSELEEEHKELSSQVDELRKAGQETIALYEERLSASEGQRYELENQLTQLQAANEQRMSAPLDSQPTLATQIDNETLREQVGHLQKKLAAVEDTLEDTRASTERDEATLRERMKRLREKEESMRKDLSEGRKEVERMAKLESCARQRVEELEEDLRELRTALEDARAEVETLREFKNLNGTEPASDQYSPSRTRQTLNNQADIAKLREMLDESQTREREVTERLNTMSSDKQELVHVRQLLEERSSELEALKKKLNRELPVNNGLPDNFKAWREEITGLKHIVQDLQKENLAASQRNKVLESENQLLTSEVEQLRQEVKLLEENLDSSIKFEEQALDDPHSPPESMESLQRALKGQKTHHEAELEQLRKRVSEAEMKTARVTHELTKEISELEALVESKIYREDELEQEVEKLKDRLARQKKSSKGSTNAIDVVRQRTTSPDSVTSTLGEGVCEICEKPGHDIFTCSLLKDDGVGKTMEYRDVSMRASGLELYCEDCESHGHVTTDCPHSLDVF